MTRRYHITTFAVAIALGLVVGAAAAMLLPGTGSATALIAGISATSLSVVVRNAWADRTQLDLRVDYDTARRWHPVHVFVFNHGKPISRAKRVGFAVSRDERSKRDGSWEPDYSASIGLDVAYGAEIQYAATLAGILGSADGLAEFVYVEDPFGQTTWARLPSPLYGDLKRTWEQRARDNAELAASIARTSFDDSNAIVPVSRSRPG